MRYVTTNIRLPEDLWKSLKIEAAREGKRLSEVMRARLNHPTFLKKKIPSKKERSLCGLWKGAKVSDTLIQEAKKSLFRPSLKNS